MRLLFILLIPALIVLGHDVILAITQDDQGFRFTSLGYIWTSNFKDSYVQASQSLSEDTWKIITPLLQQKAILLALGFAAFAWGVRFVLGMFGIIDIRPEYVRRKDAEKNAHLEELEKIAAKKAKNFGFRRNR